MMLIIYNGVIFQAEKAPPMTTMNRQYRLKSRPVGLVKESDFEFGEEALPEVADGHVLVQTEMVSLDPAMRGWLNDMKSYVPPVQIGEVMRALGVGTVIESKMPGIAKGDKVAGLLGWQDYALVPGKMAEKVPEGVSNEAALSVLGMTGRTAYFGFLDIGEPKEGETVVVSGAAGAVGSVVGQIAKIKGCRVVGIAGGAEKCAWLTDELGFDAAIDYKSENLRKNLKEACPDGVDIYFDNVGGKILDTVLTLINVGARIPFCGAISGYNATEPVPGPYNYASILVNRAKVQGFIVFDFVKRYGEASRDMGQWVSEGKIKFKVDVVEGLEKSPTALNKLFDGSNTGKLIIKVA